MVIFADCHAFMFLSTLPFGTSLIYLLLIGGFVIGGLLLLVGWRRQLRSLKSFGAVVALLGLGLLSADVYFEARMNWNPAIASDEAIFGTWADERETITLHPDHRVDYHSWNEGFSGTWSRNDWNLRLQAEGVDSLMRFVNYHGELRLMTNPPDDLDEWNGEIGLLKTK